MHVFPWSCFVYFVLYPCVFPAQPERGTHFPEYNDTLCLPQAEPGVREIQTWSDFLEVLKQLPLLLSL